MISKREAVKRVVPGLGIDIGRVLMCPADDDARPDTSFLDLPDDQAIALPASPYVWETVPELVDMFDRRVWLVSKAGKRIEALTRRWLEHHGFFEAVGLPRDHVRFCRKRPEKRAHALDLGLTHFIDDRADVLEALVGAVPHLYLFGVQRAATPAYATHVADWLIARDAVIADLGSRP